MGMTAAFAYQLLGQLIIGLGNTSQAYNNTNAQTLVGDSTQTFGSSQNSMGSSGGNFAQSSMDGGFPSISTTSDATRPAMMFRSTFDTGKGNFAWQEWGIKNSSASGTSTGTGILMNRVVTSLGTKTGAQTWQFTTLITPST